MDIEERVNKHDVDMQTLTLNVSRLATMFEYSEKQGVSVLAELRTMNEKFNAMAGIQKDITDLTAGLAGLRHDLRQAENGLLGIALLGEKLAEHKTDTMEKIGDVRTLVASNSGRLKAIEDRNQRLEGGVKVVEKISGWMWAVIAAVATGVISNWSAIQHMLGRGLIGGE